MALTPEQLNQFKTILLKNKEKTGNTLLGIGKEPEIEKENDSQLRYLLSTKKIPAGVQTNVGNVLSVVEQVRLFAHANPEGKFKGLTKGIRKPLFMQSEQAQANRATIESINLLTQHWASGAALTDAQTAQVMRMVPDKNDTDKQVRVKTNNLLNLMYADTNGKLKATGIFGFKPKKEDMFGRKTNLQNINFKF